MKTRLLSLALALSLVLAFVPAAAPQTEAVMTAFNPVTGWEMMNSLGLGINIGNTLDARWDTGGTPLKNHMDTETLWGTARIEQWQFKAIKQKGFDNVRIPISWSPHMDKDGKIYKEWMDRVQQCVDWALAEGLYVVINTHHEGDGYYQYLGGKNENYSDALTWLTTVWGQIADRFKDYPETLIFEPMNEPNIPNEWFWDMTDAKQIAGMKEFNGMVNKLNHDVLDFIRKSGGSNDKRVVMLTMAQASILTLDQYEQPDDPYTMLGAFLYPENGNPDLAIVDKQLAQVKGALEKKIPVVLKETSPFSLKDPATELAWAKYVYTELGKLGAPSQWWNCGGGGSEELFDRAANKWNKPMLDVFFAAYGKTPGSDMDAPPHGLPYTLEEPYDGEGFTYWDKIPAKEFAAAEKMVVEYEGNLTGGYTFVRFTSDWQQFDSGDKRITQEPGKLTFDIRGLEGNKLAFAAWGSGDAKKITRIYIDTWDGTLPPSLSNFTKTKTYNSNFPDLTSPTAQTWVPAAYEYGLMSGGTDGSFGSADLISVEQVLVVASRVHMIYTKGAAENQPSMTGWINYAKGHIIDNRFEGGYGTPATRAEVAYIMGNILEDKDMEPENPQTLTASDVPSDHRYYADVKRFYEAGMVSGRSNGDYDPNGLITREECAVIFVRVVDPSRRR